MAPIDYILIIAYIVSMAAVGFARRVPGNVSAGEFILGGRTLTLPAFTASLVSTWYGGILGVGEYSYRYGLSNWLVFGVPYYLAAFLFAYYLAGKARRAEVLTIPDRLDAAYGKKTAAAGSILIFLMAVPAGYILMLAVLIEMLFGWPFWVGVLAGTIFSLFYILMGGFRSVVRTDIYQFILMYLGFIILFIILVTKYGGLDFIVSHVPESHLTWHGGNSGWYIAVWYFIALQTFIEPAFHQRCYAAKTEAVARKGILLSIVYWFLFDLLTTSCGLYARALLPDLSNPVSSFPALAQAILQPGVYGIFVISMLVTVMSTIDSYSFLAASTFGRDIAWRLFGVPENRTTFYTRVGLVLCAVISIAAALFFQSVIEVWHHVGSVGTPALLIPVLAAFLKKGSMSPKAAFWSVILSGGVSLIWLLSAYIDPDGTYWLGLEPIFPGLAVSAGMYLFSFKR